MMNENGGKDKSIGPVLYTAKFDACDKVMYSVEVMKYTRII